MVPYIDLHCDTLTEGWKCMEHDIISLPSAQVDLNRLKKNGCRAQFFAIYMVPLTLKTRMGALFPNDEEHINRLYRIFQTTLLKNPDSAAFAGKYDDLRRNTRAGKVSAFLSMEDGRAIDGRLSNLKRFYKLGVRLLTLTWNLPNCLGVPCSGDVDIMSKGLSKLGKDAVSMMNDLGMIVDVSHLSDGGFWDVEHISKKPFVASHSGCREIAPHPRNLSDQMLRAIGDKGGVVGISFNPFLLTGDPNNKRSTCESVFRQMHHVINVAGIDALSLGSDFDNSKGTIMEISGAQEMPLFFEKMLEEGFTADQIEKIATKNSLRVIKDTL
ncbi:MAG: dipeptidase [Eubacteriales bacterium]